MIELKAKESYILAPHVLQKHLNDGNDDITVDFGVIKAKIHIEGSKSAAPVILKGESNENSSNDRSKERNNAEVRKTAPKKSANGTTNGQEAEVAK